MAKSQFSKGSLSKGLHTGSGTPVNIPIQLLMAAVQGILCAGLAMLACAWVYCRVDIPDYAAPAAAICSAGLGTAVTAFAAAKRIRQGGLWIGLGCGAVYFVLFVVSAFLNGQTEFTTIAICKLICLVAFGGLGGVLGVGSGETRRHAAV